MVLSTVENRQFARVVGVQLHGLAPEPFVPELKVSAGVLAKRSDDGRSDVVLVNVGA